MRCSYAMVCLLACTVVAAQGAAVNPITAVSPSGTLSGAAGQETVISSITADGKTFSTPDLAGIKGTGFIHLLPNATSSFTNGHGTGLANANNRTALVGLQAGRALLGIDNTDEYIRTYFVDELNAPTPVNAAGYIFILEWAGSRDSFVVDLLTNTLPAANSFTEPVVAATVNISPDDYNSATGLSIETDVAGTQPIGGVAIKLADVGVSGITGIQIRPTDVTGALTGLDLAVVAIVVPEPATLLMLAGGLVLWRRRR